LLFFWVSGGTSFSQNLIRNFGFEDYSSCTDVGPGAGAVIGWWNADLNGSVDYFNVCDPSGFWGIPHNLNGYQTAFGNGYIGLGYTVVSGMAFGREYFESFLMDTLCSGKRYCYSQKIVSSDIIRWGSDGFGVHFSDTLLSCASCLFSVLPQVEWPTGVAISDTTSWQELSGSFLAQGGELFITIGCFRPDTSIYKEEINPSSIYCCEVYYFIDDLSLSLCRPPVLGSDTMLVYGSSVVLGDTAQDVARYQWFPSDGLLCDTCWQTLAHPLQDTEYILQKITACDTTYDSVRVTVLEPGFVDYHFSLSPNPSAGSINLNYSSDMEMEMMVYNSLGQELKKIILPASSIGTYTFYLDDLSNGVYFFIFSNENKKLDSQRIVIYR
jgi:hypothetical protein